uniref:thioredoxin-dependent peroxiredoxin n=1 Tax=Ornithorhynchus anatinus TaxID=9258 RepID=F7DVI5_ORNAN
MDRGWTGGWPRGLGEGQDGERSGRRGGHKVGGEEGVARRLWGGPGGRGVDGGPGQRVGGGTKGGGRGGGGPEGRTGSGQKVGGEEGWPEGCGEGQEGDGVDGGGWIERWPEGWGEEKEGERGGRGVARRLAVKRGWPEGWGAGQGGKGGGRGGVAGGGGRGGGGLGGLGRSSAEACARDRVDAPRPLGPSQPPNLELGGLHGADGAGPAGPAGPGAGAGAAAGPGGAGAGAGPGDGPRLPLVRRGARVPGPGPPPPPSPRRPPPAPIPRPSQGPDTFVCPTEIIAFGDRIAEFRAINTEVVACSVDSQFTHLAWINTPRKQGGLGPMKIPLLSDLTRQISKDYGVYLEDLGHTLRGLFIIDDKGVLRQITMNDLPVGRSVDETLRLVQAFQYTDKHGEVCPAGWKPGSETIRPEEAMRAWWPREEL